MRKNIVFMFMSLLIVGILTGCGNADKKDEQGSAKATDSSGAEEFEPHNFDEHMTISMLTTGDPIPHEGNAIFELIEEKFNVTFDMHYYDRDDFDSYVNTLAASGDLPDVWRFGYNDPQMYSDWSERGVYYDIKPLLEYHPELEESIPTWAWEMLNPAGHYYGVPEYRLATRNMLAIRQDWLDNLGLEVPDTIEEFYEVAYAFAHDDPDGNGENDTIGFSAIGLFSDEGTAWRGGVFGLARNWKEIDGELVPYQAQLEELEEYIGFMRKAYEEGVLDKDFMLHSDWRDANVRLSDGIAGIEYVNPNSTHRKEELDVKEHDPNAELTYFDPPAGLSGERTTPTRPEGYFKKVINSNVSDAKAHRILSILEWNVTEGYEITRHGIEDVHYTVDDDGTVEELDAWEKDSPADIGTALLRGWNPLHRSYWWLGEEFEQTLGDRYEWLEEFAWDDDNPGLLSDTNIENGAQLSAEFEQTLTQVVVGQREMDDVETAVNEWLENGGNDIIAEINEAYQKYNEERN